MAVYLIGFALSTILIAYAQKQKLSRFLIISAFALLIPCLIAGLRSQFIGTDVLVYGRNLTMAAIRSENLKEFFQFYWYDDWRNIYVTEFEPAFSLLVYGVAKLTKSLQAVLFTIQAIMIIPVYTALARNRKDTPVWLGMLVYYLLFFNATLNLMRQFAALCFLLLAFQMLRERKTGLTALFCLLALSFHFSSVIAVAVYGVYWLLFICRRTTLAQQNLQIRSSVVVAVIIFAVGMVAILNLPLMIKLLSAIGFDRYNNYLDGNQFSLMLNQIILRVPLLAVLVLNWKDLSRTDRATPFYLAMVLLDIVASQLVSVDVNAIRVGYFFSIYSILWIPLACRPGKEPVKRTLVILMIIGYCLFYWYYIYVMQMRHQTIPYHFFF